MVYYILIIHISILRKVYHIMSVESEEREKEKRENEWKRERRMKIGEVRKDSLVIAFDRN